MTEQNRINWQQIILQGVAQIIILGGFAIGYVVTNERWKGGKDAEIKMLTDINTAQAVTNERLRMAIEKIGDSMATIANNQAGVIKMLDYHMQQDATRFQQLNKK